MAHKQIKDKIVVDWTTGDPEGDRLVLLAAYRDFLNELIDMLPSHDGGGYFLNKFKEWKVSTDNQIDEVPRIWIKRPE